MVLSARIVSPSSECTTLCLVGETVTTLYDENQAFLDAAPKTSTGAVTSLVRKPSYTRMPIVDVAARAGMARPPAKTITATRTASRLGTFIAISYAAFHLGLWFAALLHPALRAARFDHSRIVCSLPVKERVIRNSIRLIRLLPASCADAALQ